MTRSLVARFVLDLRGNLEGTARRFGRAFERLGRDGDRELGRVGRAAAELDRRLNRGLVRGFTAVGVGAGVGIGVALRHLGTMEERLERIGAVVGRTREEMIGIMGEIRDIAGDAKIRVDADEIVAAMEQFQDLTGEFDFANGFKRELAQVIKASGLGGEQVGVIAAELFEKFGFQTGEEMMRAFDTLLRQGDLAKVPMHLLGNELPAILGAHAAFGRSGIGGLAEAAAIFQTFRMGGKSAPQATTIMESVGRTFTDNVKLKEMEKAGIRVRDEKGDLLQFSELIKNAIIATKGDAIELGKYFDAEGAKGMGSIGKVWRETGGFGLLDELMAIRGDGAEVEARAERLAGTLNSSVTGLTNAAADAVEQALLGPLTSLTDSLNALHEKGVKFTLDDALNVAMGGAVAVGGAKLTLGMLRMLSGGGGKGAPGGGSVGGGKLDSLATTPVWVMNWPAGFGAGGIGADGRGGRGKGKGAGWFGELMGFAGPTFRLGMLGLGVGAASGGVQQGDAVIEGLILDRLEEARRDKDEFFARRRAQLEAGGSALSGAFDIGRDPRMDVLIEEMRDNTEETAAMARRLERAIIALGGKLAPRSLPLGPDPRTGRMMVGPQ